MAAALQKYTSVIVCVSVRAPVCARAHGAHSIPDDERITGILSGF